MRKIKLSPEVLLKQALLQIGVNRQQFERSTIAELQLTRGELIRETVRELDTKRPDGRPRIEHLQLWRNEEYVWETTKHGRVKSLQPRASYRRESPPNTPQIEYRRRRTITTKSGANR